MKWSLLCSITGAVNKLAPAKAGKRWRYGSVLLAALLLIQAAVAQTKVLIVAADLPEYTEDVRSKLSATGVFTAIDVFDARSATPALTVLQHYNSVFVWSDKAFDDPITLGNNLAAYIDGGGGVVAALFSGAGLNLAGNFNTDAYRVIVPAGQTQEPAFTLGTVQLPAHPLMQGVTDFNGGSSSYRSTATTLAPGGYRVADWSDGSFLITAKNNVGPKQVNRVDLGFFPPSEDARAGFWLPATNGITIMKNALLYVAGTYTCTPPAGFMVNGGGTGCTGGPGLLVLLSNSQAGISYQLQLNAIDIGTPLAGTGSQLNFGNQLVAGTYTVKATSIQNPDCTAMMPGSAVIILNPLPVVDVVPDKIVCNGSLVPSIHFSSAVPGTGFYWTSDNTGIGMLAAGTGDIPAFTAINTANTAQAAHITVTPVYTAGGTTCYGTPAVFTIMVNTAPVLVCPAGIMVSNAPGQCGAIVNFTLPAAIGYPAPVVTAVPAPGSFFPAGATTVTVTATNSCAAATCSFTITVKDTTVPIVNFPGDITVNAPANSCGAILTYPLPVVTDNCGSTRVLAMTQSGSNTIQPGNSVSCNDGVNHFDNSYYRVYDLAAMALPGPVTIQTIQFGIEQATSAGGAQPVTVKLYTLTGNFELSNLTPLGSETFTVPDQSGSLYTATLTTPVTVPANARLVTELFVPDGTVAGNSFLIGSNTAPQTGASYIAATVCGIDDPVDIADAGYPGMHIILNAGGYASGALVPVLAAGLPSGSSFATGNTVVTYKATDAWGNTGTASFTIHVKDITPPVVLTKNSSIALGASGTATVTPQMIDAGSYDACGIAAMQVTPAVFTCADKGFKTVVLTVTDNSGNTAAATATVTITGGAPAITITGLPAVACLSDTAIALAASQPGGTWSGTGVSGNYFYPSIAGVGAFSLQYTYTNPSGCTAVAYGNIAVQDCIERHRPLKEAVVIYPNPVTGRFYIKFLSDRYTSVNAAILDAQGRVVKNIQLTGLSFGKIIPVTVNGLPAGIYILALYSNAEKAAYKLIVQ